MSIIMSDKIDFRTRNIYWEEGNFTIKGLIHFLKNPKCVHISYELTNRFKIYYANMGRTTKRQKWICPQL